MLIPGKSRHARAGFSPSWRINSKLRSKVVAAVNTRTILGTCLLLVALLIYGQKNAVGSDKNPRQASPSTLVDLKKVHDKAKVLLRDRDPEPQSAGDGNSGSAPKSQKVLPSGAVHAPYSAADPPSLWSIMHRKRQLLPGSAGKGLGKAGHGSHSASSHKGGSASPRSRISHEADDDASASNPQSGPLPDARRVGMSAAEVYIPEPNNDKEWYEWDQVTAQEYVNNLTLHCRMPWDMMHHQDKENFFKERPMCGYLNACDAEIPAVEDSKVTMEYAGYIEQYSDKIRYMHMPMLAQLQTGTLIAAWQASPIVLEDLQERDMLAVEGMDQQHIRMSYAKDREGKVWSSSRRIQIPQQASLWSPVLHVDRKGKTWLFYSESAGCRKSYVCNPCAPRLHHPCRQKAPWETEVCESQPALWTPGGNIKVVTSDNPLAADPKWSKPRLLLSSSSGGGIPKVICNRLAVLSSGEWLLPYWREQTPGAVEDGTCKVHEKGEVEVETIVDGQPVNKTKQMPPGSDCYMSQATTCSTGAREYSGVLRSTDGGKTWKTRGTIMLPNTHLIEGTVSELKNGTVLMVFRTQVGCLYKSLSTDKGLTWSQARPMNLPNPNSKVHMMRMEPEGHLLLAFNNHRGAGAYRGLKNCRGCRSRLHLAMSIDDGESWRHLVSLDDELSSSAIRIHYPSMVQLEDEPTLMVAYSRFYLGRKMGLTSPDQGVVVMKLGLQGVISNIDTIFAPPPPPLFNPS